MVSELKPGSVEIHDEETNAGEIRFKSLLESAKERVLKVKEDKAIEKRLEKQKQKEQKMLEKEQRKKMILRHGNSPKRK